MNVNVWCQSLLSNTPHSDDARLSYSFTRQLHIHTPPHGLCSYSSFPCPEFLQPPGLELVNHWPIKSIVNGHTESTKLQEKFILWTETKQCTEEQGTACTPSWQSSFGHESSSQLMHACCFHPIHDCSSSYIKFPLSCLKSWSTEEEGVCLIIQMKTFVYVFWDTDIYSLCVMTSDLSKNNY